MTYSPHISLSTTKRRLPPLYIFLHLRIILATLVGAHAVGIVVFEEPRDLLATGRRERVSEEVDARLVREHALEQVA